MTNSSRQAQPPSILGDVFVLAAITSAIHGVALWMQSETIVDLDFSRPVESDYVEAVQGWGYTPAGLAVLPAEQTEDKPVLMIGVSKTAYDDLFLDIQTTRAGHGNVRALLLDSRYKPDAIDDLPASESNDAPWRLGLGRSQVGVDASGLVARSRPVNLAQLWPDSRSTVIAIEPLNDAVGPLIRSIHLRRRPWRWSGLLIPFLWMSVTSAAVFLSDILSRTGLRRLLTIVCFLLVAAACFAPVDVLAWGRYVIGIAACAGVIGLLQKQQNASAYIVLLMALLYIGVDLRLAELNLARFRPLDPDAESYQTIAASMRWFYDTGYREPLFILFQKISLSILGTTDYAVRMVSFTASVALIPLAALAGRRIHSMATGLIMAALIATSPEWASQAVRGLRLESFTIGLLALTTIVLAENVTSRKRHLAAMIAAASTICLIRITSLWFCLLALAFGIYKRGWSTKDFCLAVGILIGVQIPFLINCQLQFEDPLFACNQHIRFYRNQEFRDQPGFPTSEELEQNSYAGPPVTAAEYFFGMHSIWELAHRTLREFNSIFLGSKLSTLVCSKNGFLHVWAVAALAAIAVTRQRVLLAWMAILIGPITWLYSDTSEPEWRLIFHTSAFIYLCMGIAATEMIKATGNLTAAGSKGNE